MKKLALILALTSGAAHANDMDYYLNNPQFMDYVTCKFSQIVATQDPRKHVLYKNEIAKEASKITTRNNLSKEVEDGGTLFAMGYARGIIDTSAYLGKVTPIEAAEVLAAEVCPEVE